MTKNVLSQGNDVEKELMSQISESVEKEVIEEGKKDAMMTFSTSDGRIGVTLKNLYGKFKDEDEAEDVIDIIYNDLLKIFKSGKSKKYAGKVADIEVKFNK